MTEIKQIKLPLFEDERGVFQKLFTQTSPDLKNFKIKQANRVITEKEGILRGLHYQNAEWAEAKLFKVINGKIQLVALCIGKSHRNFGLCKDFILTKDDNPILIPRDFATGYLVLESHTEVVYFSDNDYEPGAESGIPWNDPSVSIKWRLTNPIISEKDKNWPRFETS